MFPEEIYELGDMLGLKPKDIRDLISNKQTTEIPVKITSPKEIYPKGAEYGTICINDF